MAPSMNNISDDDPFYQPSCGSRPAVMNPYVLLKPKPLPSTNTNQMKDQDGDIFMGDAFRPSHKYSFNPVTPRRVIEDPGTPTRQSSGRKPTIATYTQGMLQRELDRIRTFTTAPLETHYRPGAPSMPQHVPSVGGLSSFSASQKKRCLEAESLAELGVPKKRTKGCDH